MADEEPAQIFQVDQVPVRFYLDNSVTDGQKDTLAEKINAHGGLVVDDESSADTVIVNPSRVDIERRQLQYTLSEDPDRTKLSVENLHFVNVCVRQQKFQNTVPHVKPLPGRRSGYARTKFTDDDDKHLVRYLATRCRTAGQGGRSGGNLYRQLVTLYKHGYNEYKWVKRHPWESWRNRYVKNKLMFDEWIDEQLLIEGPANVKATFPYDVRLQKKYRAEAEEEEESGEEIRSNDEEQDNQNQTEDQFHREISEDLPVDPRRQKRTTEGSKRNMVAEKRRRTESRFTATADSRKKGKGKRIASPVADDYEIDINMFGNEAGPSGTQHSPQIQPVSPFHPRSSQATLIGTQAGPSQRRPPLKGPTQPDAYASPDRRLGISLDAGAAVIPRRSPDKSKSARKVAPPPAVPAGRFTRSMSHDPSAVVTTTTKTAALPPLEEDDATQHPIGVTLAEEIAVEDELLDAEASGMQDDDEAPGRDLDSDDQQTREALERNKIDEINLISDDEEDEGPIVGSSRPTARKLTLRGARRNVEAKDPPKTPRKSSAETIADFPVPGSRARAEKEKRKEQQKRVEYMPKPGTRAAALRKRK